MAGRGADGGQAGRGLRGGQPGGAGDSGTEKQERVLE